MGTAAHGSGEYGLQVLSVKRIQAFASVDTDDGPCPHRGQEVSTALNSLPQAPTSDLCCADPLTCPGSHERELRRDAPVLCLLHCPASLGPVGTQSGSSVCCSPRVGFRIADAVAQCALLAGIQFQG